jgi:UDP-N-acetylglucosamine 2-epimerase (non-hydrolysing)/GDP/UDP-N,N'-diacetylbacillosamine 2-epimerase (hydrolysing)
MPTEQTALRLAVVSSSRADLAHLIHPLRGLDACAGIDLVVVATGALLQPEYGHGVQRLHSEGFRVEEVDCPLEIDSGVDAARAIGAATIAFADVFNRLEPELLVVIADRFEMLAPASAALAMRIPIAHIEGGERSEGAIDDAVRNALTKLSHLHLVTTAQAEQRVLVMGEEPWRVHRVGAASLDHLRKSTIPNRSSLEMELGIPLSGPLLLVGMHPVTLSDDPASDTHAVLHALAAREERLIFCFPNADEASREIRGSIAAFTQQREATHLFTNLPPETWFGLLHLSDAIIGNSSSVLMESPAIPLPAVCIGTRQEGRERASNVIDAPAIPERINLAIDEALAMEVGQVENPYGQGDSTERIVEVLSGAPDRTTLLAKHTTIQHS